MQQAAAVECKLVILFQPQRTVEIGKGRVVFAFFLMHETAHGERVGVIGGEAHRLIKIFQSAVESAAIRTQPATPETGAGVLRLVFNQ